MAMRFNTRTIVALVMVIVALIFVAIPLGMNWWGVSLSGGGYSGSADASLSQFCISGTFGTGCESLSTSPDKAIPDTAGLTSTIMLVGLLLVILALVFFILAIFLPKIGIGAFVCGLIGGLMPLVAFLYYFAAWPGAMKNTASSMLGIDNPGFFGSSSPVSGVTVSWGGSIGWYMAIVAFILALVASILVLMAVRAIAPMGNIRLGIAPAPAYAPYPQQPAPGYPPAQYPQQGYGQPGYQAPAQYPQYGAPAGYPPAQQAQPAPVYQQPVAGAPAGAPASCPSCGTAIDAGQIFCKNCGTRVG